MKAQALARHAVEDIEKKGQKLPELQRGDSAHVQSMYDNYPNKMAKCWFSYRGAASKQYQVIVDGSRRITLGNRKLLKKINLIARRNDLDPGLQITSDITTLPSTTQLYKVIKYQMKQAMPYPTQRQPLKKFQLLNVHKCLNNSKCLFSKTLSFMDLEYKSLGLSSRSTKKPSCSSKSQLIK